MYVCKSVVDICKYCQSFLNNNPNHSYLWATFLETVGSFSPTLLPCRQKMSAGCLVSVKLSIAHRIFVPLLALIIKGGEHSKRNTTANSKQRKKKKRNKWPVASWIPSPESLVPLCYGLLKLCFLWLSVDGLLMYFMLSIRSLFRHRNLSRKGKIRKSPDYAFNFQNWQSQYLPPWPSQDHQDLKWSFLLETSKDSLDVIYILAFCFIFFF